MRTLIPCGMEPSTSVTKDDGEDFTQNKTKNILDSLVI